MKTAAANRSPSSSTQTIGVRGFTMAAWVASSARVHLGILEADRDPTARQCQDDRLSVFQMRQFIGKSAAGVAAICEFHATTSPK